MFDKKEYQKQYTKNNRERVNEMNRLYKNRDKEKWVNYHKQYNIDNKKRLMLNDRLYKNKDKKKWREYGNNYMRELRYINKFGNVMGEYLDMLNSY